MRTSTISIVAFLALTASATYSEAPESAPCTEGPTYILSPLPVTSATPEEKTTSEEEETPEPTPAPSSEEVEYPASTTAGPTLLGSTGTVYSSATSTIFSCSSGVQCVHSTPVTPTFDHPAPTPTETEFPETPETTEVPESSETPETTEVPEATPTFTPPSGVPVPYQNVTIPAKPSSVIVPSVVGPSIAPSQPGSAPPAHSTSAIAASGAVRMASGLGLASVVVGLLAFI